MCYCTVSYEKTGLPAYYTVFIYIIIYGCRAVEYYIVRKVSCLLSILSCTGTVLYERTHNEKTKKKWAAAAAGAAVLYSAKNGKAAGSGETGPIESSKGAVNNGEGLTGLHWLAIMAES